MIEFDKLSDFFAGFYNFKRSDRFIYLDFHLHTTATNGFNTMPLFLDFLQEKTHLISITDHNEIRGAVAACEVGINNVPGIEVGCVDGFEILVYFKKISELEDFYIREVEPHKHPYRTTRTDRDIFYFLDSLAERKCHISIPHINGLAQQNYLKNKSYIKSVLPRVDAVETYNHGLPKNRNISAQIIRKTYQLEATFGSDAHINHEMLSFYRFLNMEEKLHHNLMDKLYRLPMFSGLAYKLLQSTLRKPRR